MHQGKSSVLPPAPTNFYHSMPPKQGSRVTGNIVDSNDDRGSCSNNSIYTPGSSSNNYESQVINPYTTNNGFHPPNDPTISQR